MLVTYLYSIHLSVLKKVRNENVIDMIELTNFLKHFC